MAYKYYNNQYLGASSSICECVLRRKKGEPKLSPSQRDGRWLPFFRAVKRIPVGRKLYEKFKFSGRSANKEFADFTNFAAGIK